VIDLACSIALFALVGLGAAAWFATGGARHPRSARVAHAGGSVLLPLSTQTGGYWVIERLGRALVRVGLSANAITLASIPFALAAALALANGHWGVGAALTSLSFVCDTLDGIVARTTGTASDAGEILDAAVDRVCEALLLGGITIHFRDDLRLVGLTLAASLASQLVTYASAKAEIYPVRGVPRGAMRRAERAVYLVVGMATSGLVAPFTSHAWAVAPLVVALALIAGVGNVSAVLRFVAIARGLRERDRTRVPPEEARHAAE
jgi:CDP-diacylglycerol--glycerol-3-phosphate 3-phosphatidyltransferase